MHEPTFMAYELRLLWRTDLPPFMPYEPFLLGVGVVFNFLVPKVSYPPLSFLVILLAVEAHKRLSFFWRFFVKQGPAAA